MAIFGTANLTSFYGMLIDVAQMCLMVCFGLNRGQANNTATTDRQVTVTNAFRLVEKDCSFYA